MRVSSLLPFSAALCASPLFAATADIRDSDLPNSTFGGTFINQLVGAESFYNSGYYGQNVVVANAEAGHMWGSSTLGDLNSHVTLEGRVARFVGDPAFSDANPATIEYDFHATLVGNALGGLINNFSPLGFEVGTGLAPLSTMWSGAVATSWSSGLGRPSTGFEITDASFHTVYSDFFLGGPSGRAAVVNSSWSSSGDAAGAGGLAVAGDALALASPSTVFVVSAGNDGLSGPGSVSSFGAAYNTISVGATGPATPYNQRADFSSYGAGDFFNPVTNTTLTGVRATVDLVAPGSNLSLAAYLGASGGNSPTLGGSNPYAAYGNPTGLFFLAVDGTSFSSPIVAGSVGLMKSYAQINYFGNAERLAASLDARVVKSILQSTASKTHGWTNGLTPNLGGTLVTTQALDYGVGAGALNLASVFNLMSSASSTLDVPGQTGGLIGRMGFDLGTVSASNPVNTYLFNQPVGGLISVTLNWFANRTYAYDSLGQSVTATDLALADLKLEVWSLDTGGVPITLAAVSNASYDTTEHLFFNLSAVGDYAIVVRRLNPTYGTETETTYGLSWVPEPSTYALGFGLAAVVGAAVRRRQRGL